MSVRFMHFPIIEVLRSVMRLTTENSTKNCKSVLIEIGEYAIII